MEGVIKVGICRLCLCKLLCGLVTIHCHRNFLLIEIMEASFFCLTVLVRIWMLVGFASRIENSS